MLPALSGWTWASVAPSTPFHFRMTGNEAATSRLFTLKDEPVTVTVSPALPAALDRLRVARFVHANAAAPATTVAAAAEPKTRVTFLRRFNSHLFGLACGCQYCRLGVLQVGAGRRCPRTWLPH